MLSLRQCSKGIIQKRPIKHVRYSNTLNYFQNKQNPPVPGINPNNPQYAHYYKPPGRPWGKIILYSLAAVGVSAGLAYKYLWPKHSFPSSVAKILRKGLWAESEKEDHNYEKALKYYKEALEQCDVEKLSHISDEYTGIQVKIGEMCERLGKADDAIDVYYDISQNYFKYLQSQVHEAPSEDTRHIVQKDLRIIIKIAELAKDHVPFLTSLLTIHLDLALHEIVKRLIARGHSYEDLVAVGKDTKNLKLLISEDGNVSDPSHNIDPEIWEPFRDEFFNARDLLSALYLVSRGPAWTSTHKTQTLSWMVLANCPVGDTLLSMCNLASLCYLTSESLEGVEYRLQKTLDNATEENYKTEIKKKKDEDVTYTQYLDSIKQDIAKHANLKKAFITKSLALYVNAIDICKKIPPHQRSSELEEATVLATYGAGVVNLHIGKYEEAEKYLKEAILRAKGSGNEYEMKEAERELNKLKAERERIAGGGLSNQQLKQKMEGEGLTKETDFWA